MNSYKVEGWMINGQQLTGEKTQIEWKGMSLDVDVRKYTFLKGIDFDGEIIVYDTSEKGAWNQLRELIS